MLRGFFSDRAGLYPIDATNRHLFLSDWEIEARLSRVNPPDSAAFLNDKLATHLLLDRLGVPVARAELAGVAADGRLLPVGRFPSIAALVASGLPLIAKPVRGSGGSGVTALEPGAPLPERGVWLLEGRIEAHAYGQAIFPDALNTIRVVTARDPDGGAAFVMGAAHRFGVTRSAPTDNRKRGGIVSALDLTTGQLSAAVGPTRRNRRTCFASHPETGGRIEGVRVPMWDQVREAALALAEALPSLAFVGWDLAVTGSGPVLVEGNASLPNPNLLQMHAPLLADARARRFFLTQGVISPHRGLAR